MKKTEGRISRDTVPLKRTRTYDIFKNFCIKTIFKLQIYTPVPDPEYFRLRLNTTKLSAALPNLVRLYPFNESKKISIMQVVLGSVKSALRSDP
jgi:hypothetical protein